MAQSKIITDIKAIIENEPFQQPPPPGKRLAVAKVPFSRLKKKDLLPKQDKTLQSGDTTAVTQGRTDSDEPTSQPVRDSLVDRAPSSKPADTVDPAAEPVSYLIRKSSLLM